MSDPAGSAVGLPDQSGLIAQIARSIVADRPSPWSHFRYQIRALRSYLQDEVIVISAGGTHAQEFPPDEVTGLVRSLRDVMYRPGVGTWFSAVISVSAEGAVDADFNYDEEPAWTRPVEPVWYVQDLEKCPRDEAARPEWLRQRLSEAFSAG